MPRKSAAARQPEPEPASLPEVLIPPSQAKDSQREAYWIELLDNPEELRKAVGTTEFFPLLREFPASLWGSRLSIYVYRLPDDDGVMIKNPTGQKKYIQARDVSAHRRRMAREQTRGGKYLLYLKLDSKETLREETVRIDGPPKVHSGQTVEMDGKPVPIGAAAFRNRRFPLRRRRMIAASSKASESAMGILAHANKTAIDMVKNQAAQPTHPSAIRSPLPLNS